MSLLWLFVVLVLSVLLHEAGHAVAAKAGGYTVTSFGIGSGKPLLLFRLPRSGCIIYLCRFGLRFTGVTWVFFPSGTPSRASDLLLASGGMLTNTLIAFGASRLLASFELRSVSLLAVWVPTVVVLLVNSVLALASFVPHRTLSVAQGTFASDGLHVLAVLFPRRFRGMPLAGVTAPLRTLSQKRAFWESITDHSLLCAALVRAADAYWELDDRSAARACWKELSALEVMPGVTAYQRAWSQLLAVRLDEAANPTATLGEAEISFHGIGSRTGVLLVARERVVHLDARPVPDRDATFEVLQQEAMALREPALALAILADRIDLMSRLVCGEENSPSSIEAAYTSLERLASQYDAARVDVESSSADVRVYGHIALARTALGDDGGAAIAYERALSAARRVFAALAFQPEAQSRFASRQSSIVRSAMECNRRLGREADAERYAHLLA
ncbi:MAG: site-2 protease family protein [Armatimonadota bacterium]